MHPLRHHGQRQERHPAHGKRRSAQDRDSERLDWRAGQSASATLGRRGLGKLIPASRPAFSGISRRNSEKENVPPSCAFRHAKKDGNRLCKLQKICAPHKCEITFEKRKNISNVVSLRCFVRILQSGRVFEDCISDVSRNGGNRPYALSVYIRKAPADDLEPFRRP